MRTLEGDATARCEFEGHEARSRQGVVNGSSLRAGGRAVITIKTAVLALTVLRLLACHVARMCCRPAHLLQTLTSTLTGWIYNSSAWTGARGATMRVPSLQPTISLAEQRLRCRAIIGGCAGSAGSIVGLLCFQEGVLVLRLHIQRLLAVPLTPLSLPIPVLRLHILQTCIQVYISGYFLISHTCSS